MPSASDEDRALMQRWFGDIDLVPPMRFLTSRGYELADDWSWRKPVPSHTISEEEEACLRFLYHEWDFGGC